MLQIGMNISGYIFGMIQILLEQMLIFQFQKVRPPLLKSQKLVGTNGKKNLNQFQIQSIRRFYLLNLDIEALIFLEKNPGRVNEIAEMLILLRKTIQQQHYLKNFGQKNGLPEDIFGNGFLTIIKLVEQRIICLLPKTNLQKK